MGCANLAGTPFYMAPDMLHAGKRGVTDDLWSLGVMMHELVYGDRPSFLKKPFREVDDLLREIASLVPQNYRYAAKSFSAEQQLLAGLLDVNPQRRITASHAADLAARWAQDEGLPGAKAPPLQAISQCWHLCEAKTCWQNGKAC